MILDPGAIVMHACVPQRSDHNFCSDQTVLVGRSFNAGHGGRENGGRTRTVEPAPVLWSMNARTYVGILV